MTALRDTSDNPEQRENNGKAKTSKADLRRRGSSVPGQSQFKGYEATRVDEAQVVALIKRRHEVRIAKRRR